MFPPVPPSSWLCFFGCCFASRRAKPRSGGNRFLHRDRSDERLPCSAGRYGSRRGGRAVECGGLENRFGRFRPTRVQIPPPPPFTFAMSFLLSAEPGFARREPKCRRQERSGRRGSRRKPGFPVQECGGLENRFGRFRPTRVQIPPPPLLTLLVPMRCAGRVRGAGVCPDVSEAPVARALRLTTTSATAFTRLDRAVGTGTSCLS